MIWLYNDKPFTENVDNHFGFIYYIEYECGSKYIGQKAFVGKTTLEARKNGIQRDNSIRIHKRKPMTKEDLEARSTAQIRTNVKNKSVAYDVVYKETDWKTYDGSSKETEGLVIKEKHIMHLCSSKRNMTYMETKMLFINEVLEDETYINGNILGKFYKDNLL